MPKYARTLKRVARMRKLILIFNDVSSKMPKYGKGLGKEIYNAVLKGDISEPFTVNDCRKYTRTRGWDIPETYLRVLLANSEKNRTHSSTYKSYFSRVSEGKYQTNRLFKK